MVNHYSENRINAAFIAAGGHKRVDSTLVPFLKLGRKTLVEHTLDSVVASDVDMVIIWSNYVDRLLPIIKARTNDENNNKPVHVITGKDNLTQSLLYAIKEYTHFSGQIHPFEGSYRRPKEFAKYVKENPSITNYKMLTVSCDIPFVSPDSINGFINRFHEKHAKEKSELCVLFAKKKSVMESLEKIAEISPYIDEDFTSLNSTVLNYVSISNEPVRVANAYLFMPFLTNERGFNIVNDVYTTRMFSHPSYWLKIAKLIVDYGFRHYDIREYLPGIAKEMTHIIGSGERLLLEHKTLRDYIKEHFSKGSSSETINFYAQKILGVKSYIDYNGNLDTMFDIDDLPSYKFAEKHFHTLFDHFKGKR